MMARRSLGRQFGWLWSAYAVSTLGTWLAFDAFSLIAILVLTFLLGTLYPLVIIGVSQVAFPGNANGQEIYVNGRLVGSKIIGQSFEYQPNDKHGQPKLTSTKGPVLIPDKRYFQSRPSATGEPYTSGGSPDNAAGTTFSNLGPNSSAGEQQLASNLQAYLQLEQPYDPGLSAGQVPVDAVNRSATSRSSEVGGSVIGGSYPLRYDAAWAVK